MGNVAVYAAVGNQPVHVKGRIILFTVFHSRKQGRILEEIPILDFLGNSGKLLVYDAPRPHIQMSHLGISHLSVRKADSHAAGVSSHKGIFLHQPVHDRRVRLTDRVAFYLVIQAVAVKNH